MRIQPTFDDLLQFGTATDPTGIALSAPTVLDLPAADTLAAIADALSGDGESSLDGASDSAANAPQAFGLGPDGLGLDGLGRDGLGAGYASISGQEIFAGFAGNDAPGDFAFDIPLPSALDEWSVSHAAAEEATGAAAPGLPDIVAFGDAFDAKGGNGGGGGGGGGKPPKDGGGGTTDPGLYRNYFSGSADGDAGYDIWLSFSGSGWTVDLQGAFIQAADYLTTVITADIGGGGFWRGKTIDDLYVTAELATIDGAGGILGQAGPSAVWTANDLTATGGMQFDVADANEYLSRGLWDDIVTHEFMHVLGFGSLWNYGSHSLTNGSEYIGAYGLAAYQEVMGDNSLTGIPVETDGGAGTAGAHWDEAALGNELMTGYINDDGIDTNATDNYLSKFSVTSLADLGYSVDYKDYPYDGLLLVG